MTSLHYDVNYVVSIYSVCGVFVCVSVLGLGDSGYTVIIN